MSCSWTEIFNLNSAAPGFWKGKVECGLQFPFTNLTWALGSEVNKNIPKETEAAFTPLLNQRSVSCLQDYRRCPCGRHLKTLMHKQGQGRVCHWFTTYRDMKQFSIWFKTAQAPGEKEESRGSNQVCHPTPCHLQGQIPFTSSQEAPIIHNLSGQWILMWTHTFQNLLLDSHWEAQHFYSQDSSPESSIWTLWTLAEYDPD